MTYVYGMRRRGFSPLCQPMEGLIDVETDYSGKYHDLLVYDRRLSEQEERVYELEFMQEVCK